MSFPLDDPETGPLLACQLAPRGPADPAVAIAAGRLAVATAPGGTEAPVGGAGWTEAAALAACQGEALERYDTGPRPQDRPLVASYEAWPLPEPAVDPAAWVGFHPAQLGLPGFPFRAQEPGTRTAWLPMRRVPDGRAVWVPAERIYLDGGPDHPHRFGPGLSTGLACGRREDPVVLRGLQETIERDAAVGAWWGGYPLEELAPAEVLAALGPGRREALDRPGLAWRFYRIDSPFTAHAVLATLAGPDRDGFAFSIGSAVRETRPAALAKAALEAVQGRHYVRALRRAAPTPVPPPLPDFPAHALYYSHHPAALAATPLATARPAPPGTAAGGPVEDLAALLARLGPTRPVLVRDMTPRGLAPHLADRLVVRVLVPGLQPLYGDDRLAPLGGPLWAGRDPAAFPGLPPHPFP